MLNFRSSLAYAENLSSDCSENLNTMIVKQCIPQLLQQVMSARYFDADLAYDLFLMMDESKVLKYLHNILLVYKTDVVKFEAVARLAYRIFEQYKDKAKQEKVLGIVNQCKWWKRLRNCPMRYEDFFKSSPEELVEILLQADCLRADLEDFCEDFKLDVQAVYVMRLKCALIYWRPVYTIETETSGKRKLVVKNDYKALLAECQRVIEKVQDKEKLFDTIDSLWTQVGDRFRFKL